jgi:hypothetical protein
MDSRVHSTRFLVQKSILYKILRVLLFKIFFTLRFGDGSLHVHSLAKA